MERITSFSIDHDTLMPGIYVSRVDFEDIVTYDLRFKRPNNEENDYLTPAVAHTIEHLFATYIRNAVCKEHVVYFGPMGCLTGFYLILKGMPYEEAIAQIIATMQFVKDYEGEVPGSAKKECGNYLQHDLIGAKKAAKDYLDVIQTYTVEQLKY